MKTKSKDKQEYHVDVPEVKFTKTMIDMEDLQKLMKRDPNAWTVWDLIGNYNEVKERLGRVPTYSDMTTNSRRSGSRIPWYAYKYRYGNWNNFMMEMGER
jgi:hypothetical protein